MFSDFLNSIKSIKPFFLLNIFLTLSLALMVFGSEILVKPMSIKTILIPILGLISYGLIWYWIDFVGWFKHLLTSDDLINLGVWLACSILTLAFLLTFSYLGDKNSVGELFRHPGFIYTLTLYLLAFVTFETSTR